ncbi:hypothetical protein L2E82_16681 [Cichorium intybus]|uniref:Uncharacterized protein n=1 Tax=Cichorium intybus TaxID=13427 RepID=A0ACB9F7G0_CICIN|nr:hypothetical protein L2E82_16681 [Cichorium intybus]
MLTLSMLFSEVSKFQIQGGTLLQDEKDWVPISIRNRTSMSEVVNMLEYNYISWSGLREFLTCVKIKKYKVAFDQERNEGVSVLRVD